eukprot:1954033-Amphidinium_carterae.1
MSKGASEAQCLHMHTAKITTPSRSSEDYSYYTERSKSVRHVDIPSLPARGGVQFEWVQTRLSVAMKIVSARLSTLDLQSREAAVVTTSATTAQSV